MFGVQNANTMNNPLYQITDKERDFALAHLSRTRDEFIKTVKNLSREQWYYKPGPGPWCPADCAQHILESELYFFWPTMEKMLSEPANPEKMNEATGKDEASYKGMENRTVKIVGQPWQEVEDLNIDKEKLISDFNAKRNEHLEWVKNTTDELRVHFTYFPGIETIDGYQVILFLSGHTTRHTDQIKEILELEACPK
jgi:hypothetical protein